MARAKKVLIISDRPNWCFTRRAEAIRTTQPDDLQYEIICYDETPIETIAFSKYDMIFCLPTNIVGMLRRLLDAAKLDIPVVSSHNSGLGRRHWMLVESIMAADYTIVNNYASWVNMRAVSMEHKYTACNISNGVDTNAFYPTVPIKERPHRVLWCASKSKIDPNQSEEMKAGQPDVKGFWRILTPLRELLDNVGDGWDTHYLVPDTGCGLDQDQMREWYNSGSYLICASSSEGTPNIALEAAACGCVVVTTPVGNMPELIQHCVNGVFFSDCTLTSGAWKALQIARENREFLSVNMNSSIRQWDWKIRAEWFHRVFGMIVRGDLPRPFTWLDTAPEAIQRM